MICKLPKTILFDWDDTLAYTRQAVVEAIEYVLKKYHKDTKQDTECAYNAGILPILIGSGKFMEEDYIKNKLTSDSPLFIFQDFKELTVAINKGKTCEH